MACAAVHEVMLLLLLVKLTASLYKQSALSLSPFFSRDNTTANSATPSSSLLHGESALSKYQNRAELRARPGFPVGYAAE